MKADKPKKIKIPKLEKDLDVSAAYIDDCHLICGHCRVIILYEIDEEDGKRCARCHGKILYYKDLVKLGKA